MTKKNTARKILSGAFFGLILSVNITYGATLTVNSASMLDVCNGELSLTEAAALARGSFSRSLSTGEINQISGVTFVPSIPAPSCGVEGWTAVNGVGANFADDIFFTNNVGTLFGFTVLGKNDDMDGLKPNGQKVILDGTGVSAPNSGITIDVESGSQIRNLVIRNFPNAGILAQALNGAKFEGLEIFGNAGNGLSIGFAGSPVNKNSRNATIGGDQPQHRNKIFANGGHGIFIAASAGGDRFPNQGIVILNNFIGTVDGTTDNGNGGNGILLQDTFGVQIGDLSAATRNVVSGNNQDGIKVIGANAVSNTIVNNFIGTNISGDAPLGNSLSGVALTDGCGLNVDFITSSPNKVGMPGAPNLISGNGWGVFIGFGSASKNVVQSNYIGSNLGGNLDLGNSNEGVYLGNSSFDNLIGGTGANEANLIAFNNRNGIYQDDGARNAYRRNRVFSNDLMGIEIVPQSGVNPNDNLDGDTGPNGLLNYPVITYVLALSSLTNVKGTYNSAPDQTYTLEFFGNSSVDATGYGEGRNFLGAVQVTTNASGNATFDATFSTALSAVGSWVTATATDSTNNTSEYSLARNICADVVLSPPAVILFNAGGGQGSFTVINSTGCGYAVNSNSPWMQVNSVLAGTVNYTVFPNFGSQRSGSIGVFFNNGTFATFTNFNVTQQGGASRKAPFDFDGDGKTDASVFRPSDGSWWYLRSSDSQSRVFSFGVSSDKIAPVDFTGDGRADIAVFRQSNGSWYIQRSEDNSFFSFPFGTSGDIPAPADFDGDGRADAAVFRPSNATWYISRSSDNGTSFIQFGASGDVPVTADYDGDGRADAAVFRPSDGSWWYLQSSNSQFRVYRFGVGTDKPVAGDYTGDGKADIAVWRPSTGTWFIQRSEDNSFFSVPFGTSGDIPVAGDYDGDGKTDISVFRPSTATWYLQRTTAGTAIFIFGTGTDKPVPSAFIP
jgi:hypothetical protein